MYIHVCILSDDDDDDDFHVPSSRAVFTCRSISISLSLFVIAFFFFCCFSKFFPIPRFLSSLSPKFLPHFSVYYVSTKREKREKWT